VTSQEPAEGPSGDQPVENGSPTRRPRTRWIAAAVFVVVAALVAGIAWLVRPQPVPSAVPAATPQQAVTGFLDALAAADADRALEFALNRPADTTLLTREVLEASRANGALAVVNVPAVEGSGTVTVAAEVTFGGQPATITFSTTKTEAGWRLGQVTSTIDPGPLPSELGATVNRQPVDDPEHLEVFPGVYTFRDGLREIVLRGSRVVVDAVGEEVRAGLVPTLTAAGKRRANRIAAASLDDCMDANSPAPRGCPNSVKVLKGQSINTKTIRWTLVGNPWRTAVYTLDAADPTQVRGATTLNFRFRCTLTQGGETYMVDQTNPVDVKYMLTVTDPKEPVVWQRVA